MDYALALLVLEEKARRRQGVPLDAMSLLAPADSLIADLGLLQPQHYSQPEGQPGTTRLRTPVVNTLAGPRPSLLPADTPLLPPLATFRQAAPAEALATHVLLGGAHHSHISARPPVAPTSSVGGLPQQWCTAPQAQVHPARTGQEVLPNLNAFCPDEGYLASAPMYLPSAPRHPPSRDAAARPACVPMSITNAQQSSTVNENVQDARDEVPWDGADELVSKKDEKSCAALRMQLAVGTRWDERTPCVICHKLLVTKYHAKKHFMRMHYKGEKHHACTRCDKVFSIKEDLTTHGKSCGRLYLCSCRMKLSSRVTLRRHCKLTGHMPISMEGLEVDAVLPLARGHAAT